MPSKRKNHPLNDESKLRRSNRAKKSPSCYNENSNHDNDQSSYSESDDSNLNSSNRTGSDCNRNETRTLVVNDESHHDIKKNSENADDSSLSSGDNDSDAELNEDEDSVQSDASAKESKKLGLPISKDISTKDNPCSDDERCDECGSCPCDWIEYCDRIEKQRKLLVTEKTVDGKVLYYDMSGKEMSNFCVRRNLYNAYSYIKFGNFVPPDKKYRLIPMCVTEEIRKMYPSDDFKYPPVDEKVFKEGF